MQQALWILRKDIKHHWLKILISLVLLAGYTIFDIRSSPVPEPEAQRITALSGLLAVLLTFFWWFLIASVVHDEALPGTRQFWITRPYSWPSLLAAKLLFGIAFINIPFFLSNCITLQAQGLPVLTNFPGLLLRQLPFTLLFLAGAYVLSAVTTGIAQFVTGFFLIFLFWLAESILVSGPGANVSIGVGFSSNWVTSWIDLALLCFLFTSSLIWIYARRQTMAARLALALLVILSPFGRLIFRFDPRVRVTTTRTPQTIDTSAIQVTSGPITRVVHPYKESPVNTTEFSQVRLPLTVTGLPPQTELTGSIGQLHFAGAGKTPGSPIPRSGGGVTRDRDGYWLTISLETRALKRIRNQTITLGGKFDLNVLTAKPEYSIDPRRSELTRMEDIGDCRIYQDDNVGLLCRSGVWLPQSSKVTLVPLIEEDSPGITMGSNLLDPFPLKGGLSPVEKWFTPLATPDNNHLQEKTRARLALPTTWIEISPQRVIGTLTREVEFRNIQLADYPLLQWHLQSQ